MYTLNIHEGINYFMYEIVWMDEFIQLCFEIYYEKYICQRNLTSDDNEMTLN